MVWDPAEIIERRYLKRRINLWRIVAIAAVVGSLLLLVTRYNESGFGDYVARVEISGMILDDTARNEALRRVVEEKALKALIVEINSPGGTFVGGEALFHCLRNVAEHKPVVAVLGSLATSAAYMVALGSDRIFAHNGTVTGSIGVIMQTADISALLKKIGIKPEIVKSSPLKAQPNPLETFTPAAREATEDVIKDLSDLFVDMVATRRSMSRETVLAVADGRIFSGRQAIANGMVDAIGGVPEARKWLAENYKISTALRLENLKIKDNMAALHSFFDTMFRKTLFSERLKLDGALSVWQRYLY